MTDFIKNKSSYIHIQQGNFTVELAITGVFFALLIAFSGDVITKLAIKGKLDRMAYSAASIVKERTQLFSKSTLPTDAESATVYSIVTNSLGRTINNFDTSKFGFQISVFQLDNSGTVNSNYGYPAPSGISCSNVTPINDLFVKTAWGNTITLYQVTLCYETSNWFGNLTNATFNRVQTYAAVMGR